MISGYNLTTKTIQLTNTTYKAFSILILLGMLLFGSTGCEDESNCCTIIDVDVGIHYQNEAGENLINSNPDFNASNIKVYYKNGDEFEYIYFGNLDAPNMHDVYEDGSGNLILKVYLSNYYEGNQSTTLVELNPGVVDTLIGEFELDSNREICQKAWLNGIEMENRFIEIIKS